MLRMLNEIRRCLLYSRDFLFARMAEILEQHTAHGRPNVSRLAQGIKLRQPCCRGCSAPNRHASKYNFLFPPRSRHPFRLLYYLLLVWIKFSMQKTINRSKNLSKTYLIMLNDNFSKMIVSQRKILRKMPYSFITCFWFFYIMKERLCNISDFKLKFY